MGPHAKEPTETSYEEPRLNRTGAVFWKTLSGELSETRELPADGGCLKGASCKGAR